MHANAHQCCLSDGHPLRLIKLQDEYKEEYENLTREEHEELIEEFTAQQDGHAKLKCTTPKGQIADVANVVRNMQLLACTFA